MRTLKKHAWSTAGSNYIRETVTRQEEANHHITASGNMDAKNENGFFSMIPPVGSKHSEKRYPKWMMG